MKKNILTGLAALTLLDVSAELAAAQNWNGPYAGLQFGYGSSNAGLTAPGFSFPTPRDPGTVTTLARDEHFRQNVPVAGAYVGYNFLVHPSWLIGVEADVTTAIGTATNVSKFISTDGVAAVRTSSARLGTEATVRGRVGYATGAWLVYATGGGVYAQAKWSDAFALSAPSNQTIAAAYSKNLTGWTVGGGAEYAVNSHLSLRAQYLYQDFGTVTVPLAATTQSGQLSISAHLMTFGVGFRF